MSWQRRFFALSVLAGSAGIVAAHESHPGYLELRQIGPETFDRVWKVPMRGDLRLGIYPQLPAICEAVTEPIGYQANGAYILGGRSRDPQTSGAGGADANPHRLECLE